MKEIEYEEYEDDDTWEGYEDDGSDDDIAYSITDPDWDPDFFPYDDQDEQGDPPKPEHESWQAV